MSRDVSAIFREAISSVNTNEVFLVLLTLSHADLNAPIRVSSDNVATTSNGNVFTAYPFELTLPDDKEGNAPSCNVVIDNIDQVIIASVRSISSPLDVSIQVVLASDPDTIEGEWSNLEMTAITYNAYTITGSVGATSFLTEPYPGDSFVPFSFPGLF